MLNLSSVVRSIAFALFLAAVMSCGGRAVVASDQSTSASTGEWHYYGGDARSTKYSPLDLINRDNVKNLKIAWTFKTDNFGPRPEFNLEETPLMVHGVLYFAAGTDRDVVAVNGATGELLWMYRYDEGARGKVAPRRNHRGVSYWTDGKGDERIIFITAGYHLIALDVKTGKPVETFGSQGIVDLYKDFDQPEPEDGRIGSSSPPIVVGDIVVVGAALEGFPRSKENVAAYVRGYNVRTGAREWIFHTIPRPGEFGNETWEKDSWKYTGNTAVWTAMSADPELGYVYLPVENPTNDLYGGDRPGNTLFGSSLVCLDAKTGKRIWHFQLVHHDIWDYDTVAPPMLLDVTVNGKKIKAVAQVTKQAFTYVFDRVTGKPVWPIVERPEPKSTVPGEKTSPTQPIPTKPLPFDVQNFSVNDLIDFTPELNREARAKLAGIALGGVYMPLALPENGVRGVFKLPSATGGANWEGGAADPETGIIYVSSKTSLDTVPINMLGRVTPGATKMRPLGLEDTMVQGLPLVKPPYGRITAINLNTGEHVWMIPNGDTPDWVKNNPALKGIAIPRTGSAEHAGLMVTKTLLFAGEGAGLYGSPPGSGGNKFRAIDKMTGEIIAEVELPANQSGIPMTYAINGKQYIAVAVGGVNKPAQIVALTVE